MEENQLLKLLSGLRGSWYTQWDTGKDVEKADPLCTVDGNVNSKGAVQTVCQFLYKNKISTDAIRNKDYTAYHLLELRVKY